MGGVSLPFPTRRSYRDKLSILSRDCNFKQLEIYPFAFTFETPIETCCLKEFLSDWFGQAYYFSGIGEQLARRLGFYPTLSWNRGIQG